MILAIFPDNPLNLESQNQAKKTFPLLSRVPQSKWEANRSKGYWDLIGQTNKQTEDTKTEITTLYI